jgi:hypothetical protein
MNPETILGAPSSGCEGGAFDFAFSLSPSTPLNPPPPAAAAFGFKRGLCAPDVFAEAAGFDLFPALLFF